MGRGTYLFVCSIMHPASPRKMASLDGSRDRTVGTSPQGIDSLDPFGEHRFSDAVSCSDSFSHRVLLDRKQDRVFCARSSHKRDGCAMLFGGGC